MGSSISATCHKCGWRYGAFAFGVGFIERKPSVPALKKSTHKFVVTQNLDDPDLNYYHEPEMYKGSIVGDGIQCFNMHLSHEYNLCPSCGSFSMEFKEICEWD